MGRNAQPPKKRALLPALMRASYLPRQISLHRRLSYPQSDLGPLARYVRGRPFARMTVVCYSTAQQSRHDSSGVVAHNVAFLTIHIIEHIRSVKMQLSISLCLAVRKEDLRYW